jgi:hypothetical protein
VLVFLNIVWEVLRYAWLQFLYYMIRVQLAASSLKKLIPAAALRAVSAKCLAEHQ